MDLRATIRKLADEAKIGDPKKPYVEAALATNGVPVVAGIGGALVIAETGDVLMYDWESKKISNPSAGERIYALAKAAQKHPELEALKPGRPSGAQNCAVCKWCGIGAGSIRMW
jgi:hypothetical protein